MFHVGQLVVCIYDGGCSCGHVSPARKGSVYTVSRVFTLHGFDCIDVAEASASVEKSGHDGYVSSRFRPVDDTKLEVFRKIARAPKAPLRIGEDA